MKTVRLLAWGAATCAFLLIVLGGVVRITGSGMGCGDHWPLCNGRAFPPLDDPATVIEWSHRMVATLVSLLTIAMAVAAFAARRQPGGSELDGQTRATVLALVLLALVALLGRATVLLELPAASVLLHLGTAMAFLATLMVVALRAGAADGGKGDTGSPRDQRMALAGLVLAGLAVLLGGLTANLNAAGACTGFPLCNGQIWPMSGGGLTHLHWMHRVVAYFLALHVAGTVMAMRKRGAPPAIRRAAMVALILTLAQVAVAAVMILSVLQPHWRGLHVAFGTGVWAAFVVLTWKTWPAATTPIA